MSETIDIRLALKQAVVKEVIQPFDIAILEPNFYQLVREFLLTLSGEDKATMEAQYNRLVMFRKGKIAKLAESDDVDSKIHEKMTTEDVEYFDAIHSATIAFKAKVMLAEKPAE